MLKLVRILTTVVLLLVGVAVVWQKWGTSQSNTLVEESNAALGQGNALASQAGAKYSELFAEDSLKSFPGNRGKLEPLAKEVNDLLKGAAEQFRAAATKLEEAAQPPVDAKLIEYWKLEAQMCRKFADSKEAFGRVAATIADPSMQNVDQLREKIGPLAEVADKLDTESKEIGAAAEKHKQAHKSKFK